MTTKAEREALLAEVKQMLTSAGYNPQTEYDQSPSDYTTQFSYPMIDWLIQNRNLSRERAKSVVAKALRQLRYTTFAGWKGEQQNKSNS